MKKYGNLLIIDDEKEIGDLLSETFSHHFEKVITCQNSEDALAVAKTTEFSIIITDVNMPGLPGDQFVRKLRASGDLTPVVFLTANATKELILTALRLGVSDVFEKPFDSDFLVNSLDRVLEIERRRLSIATNKSKENQNSEKKMLGILQVVSESKKAS